MDWNNSRFYISFNNDIKNMPLSYILRRVTSEMGLTDGSANPAQQQRAIDIINEACEAIWEETDLPNCLDEMVLNVQANFQLSIPGFVGELRAMREQALMHKWTLNDMRPHYQNEPWKQLWRNWRHKGYSAIMQPIQNAAPLIYTIATADGSSIIVTGTTAASTQVSETITFPVGGGQFGTGATQSFTDIRSISDPSGNPRTYDITVEDQQGNILAVLYNTDISTRYIVVDVSQYPFGGETQNNARVMEVLYKRRLRRLQNPQDTFDGTDEWDKIIVAKALQIFTESLEGKEQRALLYNAKVNDLSHKKIKTQEGGQEKEMQFAENPYYGLTKRPYSRIWRG